MRLFEIIILLIILPVIIWPLLPWKRPRWADFLPAAAVLLLIVHLIVDGFRWQMLPAAILVLLLFLLTLPRLRRRSVQEGGRSGWLIAGSILGLCFWLFALALPFFLPVPRLPRPSGPYAVGTQSFHLIDESREEIYTADPADVREIMAQIWYPAEPDAQGEPARYLDDLHVMGSVVAERLGLPSFLLNHIDLVDLGAKVGVPLLASDGPYPLLVFSHGLRGFRAQNTALVRELASQGFAVITIDHTYGNLITIFPDGRAALHNPAVLSDRGDPPQTSNQLITFWADDIAFVLDQLADEESALGRTATDRLDLSTVGVFGHSTGGGTAVEFCSRDARCKAGVGLDAWVTPISDAIVSDGLDVPFFFLRADQWGFTDTGENFDIVDSLRERSPATIFVGTIEGASHFDFSDVPLLSPLTPLLGLSGDMPGPYVVEMVNHMTTVFFLQELQEDGEERLLAAMVYPEMSLLGNGR